jgi:hypothetical protein
MRILLISGLGAAARAVETQDCDLNAHKPANRLNGTVPNSAYERTIGSLRSRNRFINTVFILVVATLGHRIAREALKMKRGPARASTHNGCRGLR